MMIRRSRLLLSMAATTLFAASLSGFGQSPADAQTVRQNARGGIIDEQTNLRGRIIDEVENATAESTVIKVFTLANLDASDALRVVSDLLSNPNRPRAAEPPPRFATDSRTNSLIAVGSPKTLEIVHALLLKLDENTKSKTTDLIFTLKHTSPQTFQSIIQSHVPQAVTTLDPRTSSVVVTCPTEAVRRVNELKKLTDALDATPPNDESVLIRCVWLVEKTLVNDQAEPVPEDLSQPIEALRKKVSLGELRTAAQLIVRSNPDQSFNVSGTANLEAGQYTIKYEGHINRTNAGRDRYDLAGEVETSACSLRTVCNGVSLGQSVILGAVPVFSKSSVFVVQIMEK